MKKFFKWVCVFLGLCIVFLIGALTGLLFIGFFVFELFNTASTQIFQNTVSASTEVRQITGTPMVVEGSCSDFNFDKNLKINCRGVAGGPEGMLEVKATVDFQKINTIIEALKIRDYKEEGEFQKITPPSMDMGINFLWDEKERMFTTKHFLNLSSTAKQNLVLIEGQNIETLTFDSLRGLILKNILASANFTRYPDLRDKTLWKIFSIKDMQTTYQKDGKIDKLMINGAISTGKAKIDYKAVVTYVDGQWRIIELKL